MADPFADLQKKLDALKGTARQRAQRKALTAAGNVVKAAIVERAPERVEGASKTALPPGAIRNSIKARVKVPNDPLDGSGSVTIGPVGGKIPLVAGWVENGHAIVQGGYSKIDKSGKRRGPGKIVGNVPAHPFVRPAGDASQQAALEAYESVMVEEVQKAMNG